VSIEENRALVRRYYDELWNRWDLSLARELLAEDLRFRGSLGTEARGIGEFCAYARSVWLAFPDFHNQVEELIADGDLVAARLSYSGTHRGEALGLPATGRRIRYRGAAWFTLSSGLIREIFVVADRLSLMEQLGPA
jgi:steroid delta-isomerase-like uncharacterized protein